MQSIKEKEEVDVFARIVALDDDQIDLAEAALLIAKDEYPNLDVKKYIDKFDFMVQQLKEKLKNQAEAEAKTEAKAIIKIINRYLFEECGFEGNRQEYSDPKNSFLNDVLDRKKGIPITLSVIYIELAKRLKLPIYGISLPAHFIVKYKGKDSDKDIYIDPYNSGSIISEAECKAKIAEFYGRRLEFKKEFLDIIPKKQILVRMLNNLKAIYFSRTEYRKAERVVRRILLITPDSLEDNRLMGFLRYESSDFPRALWYFKRYLRLDSNAPDADQMRRNIDHIKKKLAELN